jgi:hypothetical protein
MKKYCKNTSRTYGKKWRTRGNRTIFGHMGKYGGHMNATPNNGVQDCVIVALQGCMIVAMQGGVIVPLRDCALLIMKICAS